MSVDPAPFIRAAVRTGLKQNRARRREIAGETDASRAELAELVRRGRQAGIPVTELAEEAGIGRERVYELLRGLERKATGAGRKRKETP